MIHLTSQNLTPKELIANVFSPLIGSVASPQAEEMCQKNNLTFVEMLQPFSKLTSDAPFRDSAGTSVSTKGLRLNICDIEWRPPQTILARKMLTESVATAQCVKTQTLQIDEKISVEIPQSEPWYEQWRETFLTVQFPADHEFTRHFVCCLIVVSSSEVNPVETATQLTKRIQMMQNITPPKLPKWFSNDVLNCYVMLHDGCSGDISKAQQSFESLKSTFGDNKCFLMKINSHQGPPTDCPDPWLRYLKRHQKPDVPQSDDSAPKTPQDMMSVTSMPSAILMSQLETPPSSDYNTASPSAETFNHPLSPVQEMGHDIVHSSNLSISTDSLTSQTMNPNVWSVTDYDDAPHGVWLTASDVENIRHFIQDFTVRALVPYIEQLVGALNDSITNKKGVSRSLLSATKRWFVTNKPGANTTQNAVVYTYESTELQTRKLGDLYFMFGHYGLAFQAYHQAKRDFNADSAWLFFAGALEMAALSAFMQNSSNKKTYDYMEEAIVTYLNICKMPQFATRATILSLEVLRSTKLYADAAKQLLRMSNEDSDLRSGVLLEQAAYCFLHTNPPAYRKYSFHSVLAGHRYAKSGQRKHAFRCYKQAYQIFINRGWNLAEDHIQYTIGKQAINLKKLDEATTALAHLLRPSSLQSALQQSAFLKEYITTQKSLLSQSDASKLLDISLPRIIQNSVRVLVTSQPPLSSPMFVPASNININSSFPEENKWNKIEEMIVQYATKTPIMIFKPTRALFSHDIPTVDSPLAIHGEPIEISFVLENTIKPAITFEDVCLLWEFEKENGEQFTNQDLYKQDLNNEVRKNLETIIASTPIKLITFNELERKTLCIKLTPCFTGNLKIIGVVGKIALPNESTSLWGKINFEQMTIKSTKENVAASKNKPQFDRKLDICVLPPAPALHVSFSNIPTEVLAGEIMQVTMNLTNAGASPLGDIFIAIESPRWMLANPNDADELPLSLMKEIKDFTNEALSKDKESRKQFVFKLFKSSDQNMIQPQEAKTTSIWLQAPYQKGHKEIKMMIYYSMPSTYPKLKYRLIRHVWSLNVNESLSMEANCNIGNATTNEIGIDLNIKNMNQVHHPLMTEIVINDMNLFCSSYKLNSDRVLYLTSPGYDRIFNDKTGLRSNESLTFRCALSEKQSLNPRNMAASKYVASKLSNITISGSEESKAFLKNFTPIGSFLIKNETKYIQVFNQNANTEEFNSILSSVDKHMTVWVTWQAFVCDSNSVRRTANGQHFIQLRNLYEPIFCPPKDKLLQQTSFADHELLYGIYTFKEQLQETVANDEDDGWAVHNVIVSRRCLMEENMDPLELCENVC